MRWRDARPRHGLNPRLPDDVRLWQRGGVRSASHGRLLAGVSLDVGAWVFAGEERAGDEPLPRRSLGAFQDCASPPTMVASSSPVGMAFA